MTLLDPGVTGRKPGITALPKDRLFGKPELARYLGISVSGVNKLIEARRGPVVTRVGRLVRFNAEDVLAWLERQRDDRSVQGS